METHGGKPVIYARNRRAWRKWLEKHHQTEKAVWLLLHKKHSRTPCVDRIEATEEALCFGWIDSLAHKRDADSFLLTFGPRKPRSFWSAPNRERAERMIAEGKMTETGMDVIRRAKEKGTWES